MKQYMPNLIPGFPQDVKQPRVLLLPQDGTQSIAGPYSPPHTHTHTHTHTHSHYVNVLLQFSITHSLLLGGERCFKSELIHPRAQHNDLYMWCYAQQWSFNTRAHPRCLEVGCHLIAVEKLIFPTLHGPRWEAGPSCSKSEYQQINWYPADKC